MKSSDTIDHVFVTVCVYYILLLEYNTITKATYKKHLTGLIVQKC